MPGFVKQVSIPPATSVRTRLSAPFINSYERKPQAQAAPGSVPRSCFLILWAERLLGQGTYSIAGFGLSANWNSYLSLR